MDPGKFEMERDQKAKYPKDWTMAERPFHTENKEVRDYVRQFIEKGTGRLRTEFEVDQDLDALAGKKLEEARAKPMFKVNDGMINDWPGDRFLNTHRCWGGRCKSDLDKRILV